MKFVVPCFYMASLMSTDFITDEELKFNHLNWVEVFENKVSTQIMFDFAQPITFKKEVVDSKSQLLLRFPGMKSTDFDANLVMQKMEVLKEHGLLQDVDILEKNGVVPEVQLVLTFKPLREVKRSFEGKEVTELIKNQLTIKWSRVDNQKPHETSFRLILDIFTKEVLDTIEQQTSILRQASNDLMPKKKIYA